MKKIMFNEVWKPICLHGCCLDVSNYGNVRFSESKKQKSSFLNKYGYPSIAIHANNKTFNYRIHRLVAMLFVSNPYPDKYDCINHKDENRENNYFENLEWCDRMYNNNYGEHNSRIAKSHSKPIIQYTLDGKLVREWDSAITASRELGFPQSAINWCCLKKKKYNSCKGFLWRYKDDKSPLVFNSGTPILKKDKEGNIVKEYDSITKASKENRVLITSIVNCLKGRSKTAAGYIWTYKE